MEVSLFVDALRLAREKDIRLILDIKDKGVGADVLQLLQREGMLQRVRFGGEWADVQKLYPQANANPPVWVPPGVTADQVKAYHRDGKAVIANFSANDHEMDVAAMKARSLPEWMASMWTILGWALMLSEGRSSGRSRHSLCRQTAARAALAHRRFGTVTIPRLCFRNVFTRWLLDPDDHVSRAAAVALVTRAATNITLCLSEALRSAIPDARANAAWALGTLRAPPRCCCPSWRTGTLKYCRKLS